MPSDNLGVGMFEGALAATSGARPAAGGAPEVLAGSGSRVGGLHWVLVTGLLVAGDAVAVGSAAAIAGWLGAVPDGSRAISLLGLPALVVLAFLERGLYGRSNLNRRAFPLYAISAGWVHAVGVLLLLSVVIGPAVMTLFDVPVDTVPTGLGVTQLVGFALGLAALLVWRCGWRGSGRAWPGRRATVW